MTINDAIEKIIENLKNDSSYYYSWQANIAMSYRDALVKAGYKIPHEHKIANEAAKNFLNTFISMSEKDKV